MEPKIRWPWPQGFQVFAEVSGPFSKTVTLHFWVENTQQQETLLPALVAELLVFSPPSICSKQAPLPGQIVLWVFATQNMISKPEAEALFGSL
jgi:hypothetical protein